MKIKIKSCSCKTCKAGRSRKRREDKSVTKSINRKIRKQNKKVCSNYAFHDSEKMGKYEIDGAKFQGHYFD